MYLSKKYKYILFYVVLTVIPIVLISAITYKVLNHHLQQDIVEKNQEILRQTNNFLYLLRDSDASVTDVEDREKMIYYGLASSIFGEHSEVVILDEKQNAVFATNPHLVTKVQNYPIFDDEQQDGYYIVDYLNVERLLSFSFHPITEWYLIVLTPTEEVYRNISYIKTFMTTIAITSTIFLLLLVYYVSSRLYRSTNDLKKRLKEMEEQDLILGEERKVFFKDELWEIELSFNKMVKRYSKMAYENRVNFNEAKLLALQAQINPHFLHNALETINSIAIIHRVPLISEISRSLSKMFRYNTVSDGNYVMLREEIEHVENYLTVQLIRFDELIEKEIDVSEEVLDCRVIKFVLQPIIENCFEHAFKDVTGGGIIHIQAYREDEHIVLRVYDNGSGIAEDDRNRLNWSLQEKAASLPNNGSAGEGTSVGILNVNNRIKLAFGNEYGVFVEEIELPGTAIRITMPFIQNS
ncbi:histidine kinase [Sporosarcina sp. FSL W7-1349]|uniref:sensor histidine kinase n=1 Tax=Sporosarcina sp. FSL W7-1349 TaxID=2921561 RepID=UPI0030F9B8FB